MSGPEFTRVRGIRAARQDTIRRQIVLAGMADQVARKVLPDEVKEDQDKAKWKHAYSVCAVLGCILVSLSLKHNGAAGHYNAALRATSVHVVSYTVYRSYNFVLGKIKILFQGQSFCLLFIVDYFVILMPTGKNEAVPIGKLLSKIFSNSLARIINYSGSGSVKIKLQGTNILIVIECAVVKKFPAYNVTELHSKILRWFSTNN
ncbi:uncharacterized protein [Temnothorax nylanderi]|uniref:uncharacterized protein n=1 Tax=Temnothorax nylanderi TaxID=102681 RepID=UPI003A85B698